MQEKQVSPVRAAIDVGSNTIHLVVARCRPSDLDIVADEVELVRIGESVTANGEISQEKREAAIALLKKYKRVAEEHDAEQTLVVATEAIRKARNSNAFLEDVKRETGLSIDIISGNVEATLTFYGATYEVAQKGEAPARLGVMDLGGGSTELVMAEDMRISWQTSLPVGSGWLHDRYLPSDPPTVEELSTAQTFLEAFFQDISLKEKPALLIVTGGSANSLLFLARRALQLDAESKRLTNEDLLRCEGLLCALPAREIARRYGQEEGRARILPAGALIMREMMRRLDLHEIMVSPHGIREGTLLAVARYGEGWLERVQAEAEEASKASDEHEQDAERAREEPFIESGRRELREAVKKFVDWRGDVLKHDEIEPVHKMRVASRRLRAAFDAYESCCKPKRFRKVNQQIKKLADLLGKARDTDVMLQGLQGQLEQAASEEQAGIHWLIERLSAFREQKQEALDTLLEPLDEDALRKQVESSIAGEGAHDGQS